MNKTKQLETFFQKSGEAKTEETEPKKQTSEVKGNKAWKGEARGAKKMRMKADH